MRRLIKIFILSVVSFTLFQPLLSGQVEVDTIDIKETVLEERHLRYMYNFALNAAFFQFEGGQNPYYHYGHIYEDDAIVLVLTDERPTEVSNLEAFVFPAEFCYLKYLNGAYQMAFQFPLKSQYHIEYLPPFEEIDSKAKLLKIHKSLKEHENSVYAIEFSGLYLNRNRFYLEVILNIRYNYPILYSTSTFYFEFEWCESRKVVYPIRTNNSFLPERDSYQPLKKYMPRNSPTIEIPALLCPIVE